MAHCSGQAPCNRFFGTVTGHPARAVAGQHPRNADGLRRSWPTKQVYLRRRWTPMTQSAGLAEDRSLFLTGPEGRALEFVRTTGEDRPCLSCAGGN